MATAYDVFGPSVVKVTTGSAGARETLGIVEDSFNIPFRNRLVPVMASSGGNADGVDFQLMPQSVDLPLRVSVIDEAVLNKLRYRGTGGTTPGVMTAPGLLIGSGGFHVKLVIAGASPWRFYFATLAEHRPVYGTKYSTWDLVFKCWCFIAGTATTVAGVTWWDRLDQD